VPLGKAFEWGSKKVNEKVNEAQRSHPKTEERIADVDVYVAREYASSAGATLQVQAWEAAKEQDGTVDILENYIAAIEAKGTLADGDVTGARKLAKTGLSGRPRRMPIELVEAAVEIRPARRRRSQDRPGRPRSRRARSTARRACCT
jgi:hypothetical protein